MGTELHELEGKILEGTLDRRPLNTIINLSGDGTLLFTNSGNYTERGVSCLSLDVEAIQSDLAQMNQGNLGSGCVLCLFSLKEGSTVDWLLVGEFHANTVPSLLICLRTFWYIGVCAR